MSDYENCKPDAFDSLLKAVGLPRRCPQCHGDPHNGDYEELGKDFVNKFLRTQVPYTFFNGVHDAIVKHGRVP